MRKRYYPFTLSDGSTHSLTLEEAHSAKYWGDEAVKKRVAGIIESFSTKRMIKDGFTPGWQDNIQAYAGGRREYDAALRARGLVEIGKDYVPTESVPDISPCANEGFVEACIESGVELSGQEASAIISGEYFKD